jgi:hypothetical protein
VGKAVSFVIETRGVTIYRIRTDEGEAYPEMTTAVDRLTRLVDAPDRHAIPSAELLPVQIEAANERLASHARSVQLVRNRVEETGIRQIREPSDLVPLLFAHTAYKSYPEGWLAGGRWDMLARWLNTVTSTPIEGVDMAAVRGIDDWLAQLADAGHYVSCSSGTSGKVSMIPSLMSDRLLVKRNLAFSLAWATGLKAERQHRLFICNPSSNNFRYLDSWAALEAAFGRLGHEFRFPGDAITVGAVRDMVGLRNAIGSGNARPEQIADYEALVQERERMMSGAVDTIAQALAASRGDKLIVVGMYALIFEVAQKIRTMGLGRADFHPDNAMMVSGGLKGADLPADYREQIMDTFNIAPARAFSMYGMQELNTLFPRCAAGRYHAAPWVLLLPLDDAGERLQGPLKGEIEGRAAFFDASHEGRWGGLISSDKIAIDYGKCGCGHEGPTIADSIQRYSDLAGGDKISCAGTIDAYVRGAA